MKKIVLTPLETGLSSLAARRRLPTRSFEHYEYLLSILRCLQSQIFSPLSILLALAVLFSFITNNNVDGYVIAVIFLVNVGIGFYQEWKADRSAAALRSLITHIVTVRRDGNLISINGNECVEGDIVYLKAGDIVPADIFVRQESQVLIDESIRTGESELLPTYQGAYLSAGASVMNGTLIGQVTAVGEKSSLGQMTSLLDGIKKSNSFHDFLRQLGSYVFVGAGIASFLSWPVAVIWRGTFSPWEYAIFLIALFISVVPELLPLISTLIQTRGALALHSDHVLVKRLLGLQELGAVRFLLTDKTGTITQNNLRLFCVIATSNAQALLSKIGDIASAQYSRNPMDTAFDNAWTSAGYSRRAMHPVKTIPYQAAKGWAGFAFARETIWRGQWKKILDNCELSDAQQKKIIDEIHSYENKGYRVIGYAEGAASPSNFLGCAVYEDPLKRDASHLLHQAKELGLSVKILTGDSLTVAKNIAQHIGIFNEEHTVLDMTHVSVQNISNDRLLRCVIFASCTPEQKLQLVERFTLLGSTAFLGEGINDTLALKKADVGIVTHNASDTARQAADLFLLRKSLHPLIKAVLRAREGFANVLTYVTYTLTGNAGTFFSLIFASMWIGELPLLPSQVLLNNILTDIPLLGIVLDTPDKDVCKTPARLDRKKLLTTVLLFGGVSTIFDLVYFYLMRDFGIKELQTGWFLFSVCAELVLFFSIRTVHPAWLGNPLPNTLLYALIGAISFAFFAVIGPLKKIFGFTELPMVSWTITVFLTVLYFFVNEIIKKMKYTFNVPLFSQVKNKNPL